jgi:hypothetical protein
LADFPLPPLLYGNTEIFGGGILVAFEVGIGGDEHDFEIARAGLDELEQFSSSRA